MPLGIRLRRRRDARRPARHAATTRSSCDSTPVGATVVRPRRQRDPARERRSTTRSRSARSPARRRSRASGGNDVIRVNFDADGARRPSRNGIGGAAHAARPGRQRPLRDRPLRQGVADRPADPIVVDDAAPARDLGVNQLRIFGTNDADFFLLRANLQRTSGIGRRLRGRREPRSRCRAASSSASTTTARSTAASQIFGRDGDDTFVLDDNLAPTTIFGDAGDDTFQVGQVFQSAARRLEPGQRPRARGLLRDDADHARLPVQRHQRRTPRCSAAPATTASPSTATPPSCSCSARRTTTRSACAPSCASTRTTRRRRSPTSTAARAPTSSPTPSTRRCASTAATASTR